VGPTPLPLVGGRMMRIVTGREDLKLNLGSSPLWGLGLLHICKVLPLSQAGLQKYAHPLITGKLMWTMASVCLSLG